VLVHDVSLKKIILSAVTRCVLKEPPPLGV